MKQKNKFLTALALSASILGGSYFMFGFPGKSYSSRTSQIQAPERDIGLRANSIESLTQPESSCENYTQNQVPPAPMPSMPNQPQDSMPNQPQNTASESNQNPQTNPENPTIRIPEYDLNSALNYTTIAERTIQRKVEGISRLFAGNVVEPSRVRIGIESKFWQTLPKGMNINQFRKALNYAPMESENTFILTIRNISKSDIIAEFTETTNNLIRASQYIQNPEDRFTENDQSILNNLLQREVQNEYPAGSKNIFRIYPDRNPEFEAWINRNGTMQRYSSKLRGQEGKSFKKLFLHSLDYPDKFDQSIIPMNNLYRAYNSK
jgi:hypothetical protein